MAMQNYAKFESNVDWDASDSIREMSQSWYYSNNWLSDIIDLLEFLLQIIIWIFWVLFFVIVAFFFLYTIISLFTKWWEETMKQLEKALSFLSKIVKNIINFIKNIFAYFWNKKILSIIFLIIIGWIIFLQAVINWSSRILVLEKIDNWYVWVDLKNNEILKPWYHLYSPLKSTFFLSPTNDFAFEIAEVTANTSEELGVTLDYRVSYKLEDEKRLAFYNKFWAKSIKLVSSEIVMPKLLEVIKWIIRNYWYKDISSKHSEIKKITLNEANAVLNDIGIDLQDISIIDIRLPQSYLKSKEDLLKSENELKLAEARLEAQKKESEKNLLEAQNEKSIKIIEAEAVAEYNKIIKSETITDDMLELKKLENETLRIEKWDWKLPTTVWDNLEF